MTKDLTLRSLREHMDSLEKKEYSSEELTLALLAQIQDRDRELNSFITLDADGALEQARLSDTRRAAGAPLSPIDGIPYAAKDNISTRGLPTTCGSPMLTGRRISLS